MVNPDIVPTRQKPASGKKRSYTWLIWLFIALAAFAGMAAIGSAGGYQVAQVNWQSTQSAFAMQSLAEQFALGVEDINHEQFDIARQRFEYVLSQDPGFPGAADKLAQVIAVLYATATPTLVPPTHTPIPTRDLRPVEELFSLVTSNFAQGDWDGTINAILALRQADPGYRVLQVDGMLFRSLRNRGISKIKNDGNLEGGIYDLALVERIGPLDAEALTYRDLARYYMMGSGFWEVYPEQAVYYFGLVASAAPYLRDGSGWTASARYQAALIQLADQLARAEEWCSAEAQYELAISYGGGGSMQQTAVYAAEKCSPPTETPAPVTEIPSLTFTPSPTLAAGLTLTPMSSPTLTSTLIATAQHTATPTVVLSPTSTVVMSPTPSSTLNPTPTPSQTGTPALLPSQTPAPTTAPSDTPGVSLTPTVEALPGSPTPQP
jgi:hypothetical protein